MRSPVETYEGDPCRHGHVTARGTTHRLCSNGACVACNREKARRSHAHVGWLTRRQRTTTDTRAARVGPGQMAFL